MMAAGLGMERRRVRRAMVGWTRRFRGRGGWVTFATVLGLLAALGATPLGLGAPDHALATSSANLWMWSSTPGEIAPVNGETRPGDTRDKVVDAQGDLVQVSPSHPD